MERQLKPAIRTYRLVAAAVTWYFLALSFYNGPGQKSGLAWLEGTINYFSYFTILSNLLVALSLSAIVLSPQSSLGRFFAQPTVRGAIALYISVTFLIYLLILSRMTFQEGVSRFNQGMLHYATPVLYLFDWFFFVAKGKLQWGDLRSWLFFPFGFAVYTLLHGAVSGFYPYPFIDVNELGYPRVLLNSLFVVAIFIALGLPLIALDRWMGKVRAQLLPSRSRSAG